MLPILFTLRIYVGDNKQPMSNKHANKADYIRNTTYTLDCTVWVTYMHCIHVVYDIMCKSEKCKQKITSEIETQRGHGINICLNVKFSLYVYMVYVIVNFASERTVYEGFVKPQYLYFCFQKVNRPNSAYL